MKVEKFNCRFSDFENMVENGSIGKCNLISITPIETNLYTVIIWVEQ